MKSTLRLSAILTLIAALAAPSLFADSRHRGRTYDRNDRGRTITIEGRVRDIDRERNGFVIELARNDYRLFVDEDARRSVRRLDRGDYVRAYGFVDERSDIVYVRSIELLRDDDDRRGGRDSRYLSGTVQSVDRRSGTLILREDRTGRIVNVQVRRNERDDAWRDLDDLRRGEYVTVGGELQRNGRFEADTIRRGRR